MCNYNLFAQEIFLQQIVKGGAILTATSFLDTGYFNIPSIPAGSTINKAYLFGHRIGPSSLMGVQFNGDNYIFNDANQISNDAFVSSIYGKCGLHVLDVTQSINLTSSTYSIIRTFYDNTMNGYRGLSLMIIFENSTFDEFVIDIISIDQIVSNSIDYHLTDLNPLPINLGDIGLSLTSEDITDTISELMKLLLTLHQ